MKKGANDVSHPLFETHQEKLGKAVEAARTRGFWSAYPEVPSGKIYGEDAKGLGQKAFESYLNAPFQLDQPGANGWVGSEASPFGIELGITYPKCDIEALVQAADTAMQSWKRVDPETRVGVALEILDRLNKRSFEMALAVMHTTGQGWMMAFQAGGPHAQDRGLEAVAYAWDEMRRVPRGVQWKKQVGREEFVTLDKTYHILPRGISLAIACSTFPTWNSYPGMLASMVTGNAVIVKPHPGAVLPLAITVKIAREVLAENGFDPNVMLLAADSHDEPIAKDLVTNPAIGIIDYTGSSEFGNWIEANAPHAIVFTEKAGVNSAVIDSIENMKAVSGNLAFSLSLYSGQMCTTIQNIFVPKDGIKTSDGEMSFNEVTQAIVKGLDWLLGDNARACEILGAIQNERTAKRINEAKNEAGVEVVRESAALTNETFPNARVHTPTVLKISANQSNIFMREMFGPIVYVIECESTDQAIELAGKCSKGCGAISHAVYSTDDDVLAKAEEAAINAGVPLSCNLTGSIWVNQSAAFSDYHVSGANPAGNATLTDAAYVAGRFRIVQTRVPAKD